MAADNTLSGPWDTVLESLLLGDVAGVRAAIDDHPDVLHGRGPSGRTLVSDAANCVTNDRAVPTSDGRLPYREILGLLLQAGADPGIPDDDGWTALHCAGMTGHEWLTSVLLEAGAPIDGLHEDVEGATPLGYACFYAHTAAARALYAAGPKPEELRTAAATGDRERLDAFLSPGLDGLHDRAGAGMGFAGPMQWFPPRIGVVDDKLVLDEALTWAARSDQIASMEALVAAGANVNANPYRGTALLWAAYADRVDAAAWLLDHGADPDLCHDFGGAEHGSGATAMHLAAQFANLGVLRLLLDRGADPTIEDAAFGGTPRGWAEHNDQSESVAVLLAHTGD